jgi:Putative peptidoglycan binding domain
MRYPYLRGVHGGFGFRHGLGRGIGRAGRFGRGRFGRGDRRWGFWGGGQPLAPPAPPTPSILPWAQSCLNQLLGPWVLQDGIMGPNTRQAVQQFQQQQQLPVTGMLDAATVTALQAACSGQQQGGGDGGAGGDPGAGGGGGGAGEAEFEGGAAEGNGSTGRWVRHKGRIVLLGV